MSRSNNSTVLLHHENSNYVALVCATATPHTAVCPLVMEQVIAYLRVSTRQQQRSGLGIDASAPPSSDLPPPSHWPSELSSSNSKAARAPTPWTDARNWRLRWPQRRPGNAA